MDCRTFMNHFPDENSAREFFERVIWKRGRFCPHCGTLKPWPITGKTARPGLYQCADAHCRMQFTVTTKTPMHATKLPLTVWLEAIYTILISSKGISSVVLAKMVGISQKTAWKISHAVREMMESRDLGPVLTGVVELDEKYVGGKPRFKRDKAIKHKRGKGTDKHPIFVAVERHGKVRAMSIDNDSIVTLTKMTQRFVQKSAHLMTDQHTAYKAIDGSYAKHECLNHGDKEFARNGVHNNTAESFNAQIERAKVGVFHWLSKDHLQRYINEVAFRWNHRQKVEKTTRKGTTKVVMEPLPMMEQVESLLAVAFGRQVTPKHDGRYPCVVDEIMNSFRNRAINTPSPIDDRKCSKVFFFHLRNMIGRRPKICFTI